MLKGTTVTVRAPVAGGPDRLGNATVERYDEIEVPGVLVAPGASADMEASRPEGTTVAFTLHFPKSHGGLSLRRALVELPEPWAGTYRVVGDPQPFMDENTPGRWNRPVEVEAAHG